MADAVLTNYTKAGSTLTVATRDGVKTLITTADVKAADVTAKLDKIVVVVAANAKELDAKKAAIKV